PPHRVWPPTVCFVPEKNLPTAVNLTVVSASFLRSSVNSVKIESATRGICTPSTVNGAGRVLPATSPGQQYIVYEGTLPPYITHTETHTVGQLGSDTWKFSNPCVTKAVNRTNLRL